MVGGFNLQLLALEQQGQGQGGNAPVVTLPEDEQAITLRTQRPQSRKLKLEYQNQHMGGDVTMLNGESSKKRRMSALALENKSQPTGTLQQIEHQVQEQKQMVPYVRSQSARRHRPKKMSGNGGGGGSMVERSPGDVVFGKMEREKMSDEGSSTSISQEQIQNEIDYDPDFAVRRAHAKARKAEQKEIERQQKILQSQEYGYTEEQAEALRQKLNEIMRQKNLGSHAGVSEKLLSHRQLASEAPNPNPEMAVAKEESAIKVARKRKKGKQKRVEIKNEANKDEIESVNTMRNAEAAIEQNNQTVAAGANPPSEEAAPVMTKEEEEGADEYGAGNSNAGYAGNDAPMQEAPPIPPREEKPKSMQGIQKTKNRKAPVPSEESVPMDTSPPGAYQPNYEPKKDTEDLIAKPGEDTNTTSTFPTFDSMGQMSKEMPDIGEARLKNPLSKEDVYRARGGEDKRVWKGDEAIPAGFKGNPAFAAFDPQSMKLVISKELKPYGTFSFWRGMKHNPLNPSGKPGKSDVGALKRASYFAYDHTQKVIVIIPLLFYAIMG